MNCRNFRELAQERVVEFVARNRRAARELDPVLELETWDIEVTRHANECEHCMRHWRGLLLHVRLLGNLERLAAPEDLAGRVVAAANAGYREDRAASRVASLARLQAPPVLTRRVDHEFRVKAPAVLDRLVENRLGGSRAGRRRLHGLRTHLSGARAVAAAAVLGLALWITVPDRSTFVAESRVDGRTDSAGYDFEIVRVSSLREASIDAGTRAWIDAVTGGGPE